MTKWNHNQTNAAPTSMLTAAIAALGLTLLFFWALAQSTQHLPAARVGTAAGAVASTTA